MTSNAPSTPARWHPRPFALAILLRTHPGLFAALGIYLFLALSYFLIVPIFEAPDEWTHTGHVKYIAEGNGLPVMLPGQGIWGGQQPPLYYAIGAILVQPFDLSDFDAYLEQTKNPHASLGYALDPGNKNNYLHSPVENFPYRGLSLTVHVLRLYSMLFGVIAVIFVYLTAYELTAGSKWQVVSYNPKSKIQNPKWFATIVTLFVACQPMFAFITASVANEPANIAFSAVGLWLAQRYILFGPNQKIWRALALGIVLGLISLSKMTGLSFILVAAVAMLQSALATRKQAGAAKLLWRDGAIIGIAFLAVGGWWYWRNYQLYGDFFQQGLYKIYFNQVPQPLSLSDFLYHLRIGEVSFWATFGWLNLVAPDWVYSVYRIISRIGLIGVGLAVILQIARRVSQRRMANEQPEKNTDYAIRNTQHAPISNYQLPITRLLIHLIFPVTVAFSLARLVALEGGLQGRQILPALGSIAIVVIYGWWFLTPSRLRWPVMGLLAIVLLSIALWLPFVVVAREYIPRPLLNEAQLPPDLQRLDLVYNNEIKLIGVNIGADVVKPGERVPVTVYWQALKPMTTNYSVFVHLIGRDYQNVGQLNTYPGLGLRPTTTLRSGEIVVDTYPVQVDGGSAVPTRLLVNVGLFNFNETGRPGIQPVDSNGNPASPTVGQLKLIPNEWPAIPDTPPLAEFAVNIQLVDVALEHCRSQSSDCTVQFEWLAQGRPSANYTVFIQLWRNGEMVQGFDTPPLDDDYPTSFWADEEVIIDPHLLDLSEIPPGEYQLFAGLYNFATGDRLSATASDGTIWPNFAVDLGQISINP